MLFLPLCLEAVFDKVPFFHILDIRNIRLSLELLFSIRLKLSNCHSLPLEILLKSTRYYFYKMSTWKTRTGAGGNMMGAKVVITRVSLSLKYLSYLCLLPEECWLNIGWEPNLRHPHWNIKGV